MSSNDLALGQGPLAELNDTAKEFTPMEAMRARSCTSWLFLFFRVAHKAFGCLVLPVPLPEATRPSGLAQTDDLTRYSSPDPKSSACFLVSVTRKSMAFRVLMVPPVEAWI